VIPEGNDERAPAPRRTVLPNGLTVLSEYMPGVRSVAFGAWVRAASLNEQPQSMGVSHLLEHMVFKGTARRSARDIALSLETLGGSLDAYTTREYTSYQARVLDEHVSHAADVIGELIFQPLLREKDLRLERKVVLEEISMVEDTPDDLVFDLHSKALWGSHPYGYSILGTRDTVRDLGVDDLRALHDTAYHPANVIVAAAGHITHERLLEVLEQSGWFDVQSRSARPTPPPPALPAAAAESHVERDGAQMHVVFGSATVPHRDPRRYPLVLASTVLGGGMSSRLFQRVREELGLAYAVFTYQHFHVDTGMLGVYVGTAPETAREAVDAVREELERMVGEGLPTDEFESGKSQLKGQVTLALESPASRMYRAAAVDLYDEPFRSLDEVLALIDAITPEQVRDVCREFLVPGRQTVLSLGPQRG
jgi:predicted Zn-dependent peptidase